MVACVSQTAENSKPRAPWKLVLIILLVGATVVLALKFDVRHLLRSTLTWIGDLGPWGPLLFIAIYVVASVLFIPASVLTLGGRP